MNTPIPSQTPVAPLTRTPAKTLAALAAFLVVALCAPFIVQTLGGNYWVRVLDFALLYIMLALGLNIVVGFAGLLDLGYIAFYAVGAYLTALMNSPHLANQFEVAISALVRSGRSILKSLKIFSNFGMIESMMNVKINTATRMTTQG